MKNTVLLGVTKDNEFVYAEYELRLPRVGRYVKEVWEDIPQENLEFSVCFDCVKPVNLDEFDLEEYYENYIATMEYCDSEKSFLYDQCKSYHCSPDDLALEMASYADARDVLDLSSVAPIYVEFNGCEWGFEFSSSGQCDTLEDMKCFVNKKAYHMLYTLWKAYHLKTIKTDNLEEYIKSRLKIIDDLLDVNDEEWILNYMENHEEDFN